MDEALRRQERAARASGDGAPERVASARALLRAGRRDEAAALLGPLRGEPLARALLAELPAWTHPDGDAGRTRCLDVAPLRGAPRVRWRTDLVRQWRPRRLLASPLGIVVAGAHGWSLLDPETGAVHEPAGRRRDQPLLGEPLAWLGPRLLLRRGRELSLEEPPDAPDPAPPLRLPELTGRGVLGQWGAGESLLLEADPARLRAWRVPDGGAPALAWERTRPPGREVRAHDLALGAGLALVQQAGADAVLALDARSGEELFAAGRTAALVDAAGLVAAGPRGQVLALTADGEVRWSAPALVPLALGPDAVLAWGEAIDLVVLERASGRLRARLDLRADGVAVAGDVVTWWGESPDARVGAATLDGAPLWELALPRDPPRVVAPAPGRLLVLTERAELLCLEA